MLFDIRKRKRVFMGVFCCCCCRIYYQSFYIDFMTKPLSIYTTAHKLHEKNIFQDYTKPNTKDLCRGLISILCWNKHFYPLCPKSRFLQNIFIFFAKKLAMLSNRIIHFLFRTKVKDNYQF